MDLHLLMAILPGGHLNGLVLVIGRFISVLDDVDMELLGLLGVIIVGSSKKTDQGTVMDETVYLWQVEVVANAKFNEDFLILVKVSEHIIQARECSCHMGWKLSQKEEVE